MLWGVTARLVADLGGGPAGRDRRTGQPWRRRNSPHFMQKQLSKPAGVAEVSWIGTGILSYGHAAAIWRRVLA